MTEQVLAGQVAIVTGGAGLIGSAISTRLAEAGAIIVINGRNRDKAEALAKELSSRGLQAEVALADVTDNDAVAAMIADVVDRHGRLDIMINNAGGGQDASRLADMSLETWQHSMNLNLTAAFLGIRHAMPPMIAAGYGRIVSVGSMGYLGVKGQGAYAAAKAGLLGLTRTAALEGAEHGITVNLLVPHLTVSPGWAGRSQELKDKVMAPVPIKRFGEPSEHAGAVLFLVGPDGGYITGEALHVAGGLQAVGPGLDLSKGLH